jgi:medium-chain acyl-[acyl-carrier-protein] hydrolase
MNDVSTRIAALTPDQRKILLQRLKQKGSPSISVTPITHSFSNEWVVRYKPNDQARLRLFCFSYAGGGASIFRPWGDILPQEVEVCSIQLPGREYRIGSPAYTRLVSLEDDLAEAIAPYLDRPFAFFGHSMGALVSFELTRLLRKKYDKHPEHLFLAAYRAPQLPNPNIKIYHLPSEVFKVVLRSEGIAEMILQNEELMQAMLPTLRADFELCDTYQYTEEPPLACPFSLFGGLEDVRISQNDLELWPQHSSVGCSLTMLPGSHFFLHSAQDQLLAAISRELQGLLNALAQRENGPILALPTRQ